MQRLHLRTKLIDDLLQVRHARQLLLHGRRQLASYLIRGYANWLIGVFESKFHDGSAPALTQKNSDARAFNRSPHRAVHCRKVEAQLTDVMRSFA